MKECDKNSNVWKENKNSNVWKDKIRILMFERIKYEFEGFEGKDNNSNVWKDGKKILMFGRIR